MRPEKCFGWRQEVFWFVCYGMFFWVFVVAPWGFSAVFVKQGPVYQVGPNPSAILAQDLNGDGLPEIITADRGILGDPREERPGNDEISILIAREGLNYDKLHPSLKTGFGPYAIAVANVDALKWPDIVVASFLATKHNSISLFLNNQQESVYLPVEFRFQEDALPYFRQTDGDGNAVFTRPGLTSVTVQDVTHDGLRDLIATGWSSDMLVFMPGHAETYFGEAKFIPAAGGPRDVHVADFDGDKESDLVVVMYVTGELTFWKGDGAGGFAEVSRIPTRGQLPSKVRICDVNRDNVLDVVVSHSHKDDSVVIFYGDGNFSFSVSQEILLGPDRGVLEHEIRDLVVEDLTGDEKPDMAVACYASGKVEVLINESTDDGRQQHFRTEEYSFDQGRPRALCGADFDQNKQQDLAVALWDVDSVALLLNGEKPKSPPSARAVKEK
ncbi:MAG TPA: VCBS repeat-containing protein [Candidatus Hydrogenedentes bacterium]|nr:VCBS repeat-containing protein [Candidatus Hydrogenedentota bacterium]